MDERDRVKVLYIAYEALIDVLNGRVRVLERLPEDARVVGLHQDFPRRALAALVWSASFEMVEPGTMPPEVPPLLMGRTVLMRL